MTSIAADSTLGPALTPSIAAEQLRLKQSLGRQVDARDPAVRAQAASRLTSELFFKPLLAEMRKFPFGRELLADGWAGSAFEQRLDERIADAVSGSSRGLIARIASDLNPQGKVAQKTPAPGSDQADWPLLQRLSPDTETAP